MKTYLPILVMLLLFSCRNIGEEAVKYNNSLIDQQTLFVDQIDELHEALKPSDLDKLSRVYKETLEVANQTVSYANELKPFEKDSSFKEAFVAFSSQIKTSLENDYAILVKNIAIPDTAYSISNEKEYDSISVLIESKRLAVQNRFNQAQEEFAAKYDVVIE